jgi:hypothetical protein
MCARGTSLAFVLRTAGEGRYRLIGPCHVHGEVGRDMVEPEDGVTGLQEIVIE